MIAKGLLWSGVLLAAMLAASAYGWTALPDGAEFPVQWDTAGEPSRFAGKTETVLMVPAITAVLIIVLAIAPLVDPRRKNLEKSRALYLTAWIGGVGVAALSHALIIYAAVTGAAPSIRVIFACVGVFIAILGNFLAKSRSNWFAGVRTPWSLSSEHAWSVSNRLAGWGLVVTGLAVAFASVFLSAEKAGAVLAAGVTASMVVAVIASYLAWRSDPDRNGGGARRRGSG